MITVLELRYPLMLITPATQQLDVESLPPPKKKPIDLSHRVPILTHSRPHCALDLSDNKRLGLLHITYHAFSQNGEFLGKLDQASTTSAAIIISMNKPAAKQLTSGD